MDLSVLDISYKWLPSLSKFSKLICVSAWLFTFLWLNNILLNKYATFLVHSSIDEHRGCFYFLSIINNGALHLHVHIFVWHIFSIFLDIYLGLEFLGHVITLMFTLLRELPTCSSKQLHDLIFPLATSPHPYQHFLLSVFILAILMLCSVFYLHFPND